MAYKSACDVCCTTVNVTASKQGRQGQWEKVYLCGFCHAMNSLESQLDRKNISVNGLINLRDAIEAKLEEISQESIKI